MINISKITSIALAGTLALGAVSVLGGCAGSGTPDTNENVTPVENIEAVNGTTDAAGTDTAANVPADIIDEADPSDPYASGIHHAVITVEGYDPITVELNADAAPISVSNFARLANEGYYNGLNFYRFQDGFCMQGGTAGNTAAGNDASIPVIAGEFSSNGRTNALADNFGRGTVAMARTMDPDSASSTFFVTLADGEGVAASLNGQYAAFGTIDDAGMATVDKIVADHIAAADEMMGMVEDEDAQAKISSIEIID